VGGSLATFHERRRGHTKGTRRLLALLLVAAVIAVVQRRCRRREPIHERFRPVDEPYSFEDEVCGIDVLVEGTASGHGRSGSVRGRVATACACRV
jgi:hypothetical protein